MRIQGSAAAHLTAEISCDCWIKLQRRRISVLTFVVVDGQRAPGEIYMLTLFLTLSDGEIISQIKMTNIALAEIKELLKQQVKTHVRQIGLDSKSQSDRLLFQIKEITFLKNTVMECEACGELSADVVVQWIPMKEFLCDQGWGGCSLGLPACLTRATWGWSVR